MTSVKFGKQTKPFSFCLVNEPYTSPILTSLLTNHSVILFSMVPAKYFWQEKHQLLFRENIPTACGFVIL
jgi:hypothetical protein